MASQSPSGFAELLRVHGWNGLSRASIDTVQVNVGKLCNQACHHCHVDAGPKRTEIMSAATASRVLHLLGRTAAVAIVDITGGAPELNPNFRRLVAESVGLGKKIIDRCNLTVLLEAGCEDVAEFLAAHNVEITASLPCYTAENVDNQRGRGVFGKSIEALRRLNEIGYGKPHTGLILNLVFNPGGPTLPPPQAALQQEYKQQLRQNFGIEFNRLLTITNMPIRRFADQLVRLGKQETYRQLLESSFNPETVPHLMCRGLVSVSWDGFLYDCDFNQMLELRTPCARSIWDIDSFEPLLQQPIAIADHCFGCTAGAGSSCGGTLQ